MRRKDIKVGVTYTNGKGRYRKVLDLGNYPLHAMQDDCDCVQFYPTRTRKTGEVVEDGGAQFWPDRPNGRCTLTSFASWAKAVAKETT